jgi:hypothetical protein
MWSFNKTHLLKFMSLLVVLTGMLQPLRVLAQDGMLHIRGKAIDAEQPQLRLEQVMIINLRTQSGFFTGPDNRFETDIRMTDTLIITASGYSMRKVCFRDSAHTDVMISLQRLRYELREATVFAPRDLNRIEQDIMRLGYRKRDYMLSGVDAWNHPLTALYQEFSRKERSKRKVAELMNEDRRRELLREVLANYARAGLIDLQYREYDRFIDYLGLSDFLLKSFSQYELAVYVKEKFYSYNRD